MKKTTPKNLSNKLLKYGAFSAAVIGAADASGQIVYTDIADETVNAGGEYYIDVNDDGADDYLFRVSSGANFAFVFPASNSAFNSNKIVGFSSYPYNYPSNLASGDIINSTNGIFSSARGDFNYSSCAYPGSQFCDGNDGYIGLHIVVGTDTYYGWARIQVASDASSITIKDYAYNSVAGESIQAGQTLSIQESLKSDVRVISIDDSIGLYNIPNNIDYKLYSVSGKLVDKGSISNQDSFVIDTVNFSSGVYVIELKNPDTNDVFRKKVII